MLLLESGWIVKRKIQVGKHYNGVKLYIEFSIIETTNSYYRFSIPLENFKNIGMLLQ